MALTRAVESVFISGSEKAEKNSLLSRLPLDLSEPVVKTSKYSYEVTRGPWSPAAYEYSQQSEQGLRDVFDRASLADSTLSFVNQTVSARVLEKSKKNERENKGSRMVKSTGQVQLLERARLGTLIHEVLERLKYKWEEDFSEFLGKASVEQKKDILLALNYIRELKDPPMRDIIQSGHVEWGYQLLKPGSVAKEKCIVEGQVDLWGYDDSKNLWVIDYKSGSEAYKEKAFLQLEEYAEAVALKEGYHDEDIRLCVIYPLLGRFETRLWQKG